MSESYYGKQVLTKIKKEFKDELKYVSPFFSYPLNKEIVSFSFIGLKEIENNALIIVNDHYRATPSEKIINLMGELGLLPKRISFLIATGTHNPPPKKLYQHLTGKRNNDDVIIHYARNDDMLVTMGETSRGTLVKVNKTVLERPQILTINSIEPHYFAGFTGGVKSIIPGCAGYDTVVQNHKWAMHRDSKIMRTWGNPVWEDLWEAGNLVKPLKEIQTIQLVNHRDTIFSVNSGDLPTSFEKTVNDAKKFYGVKLEKEVDHLITIVQPPLDKNLYQSHKAIENTKYVIKDGGSLVLVAENAEGIGTKAFYNTLKSFSSPKEVIETLTIDNYHFGDHKAYKWAETADRIDLLYLGNLDENTINNVFMRKISENDLYSLIYKWLEMGENVVVDEMGGYTTLYTKNKLSIN